MELMKQQLQVMNREKETGSQFTVEEECNVPDQNPDMGRLIQYDGKISIAEVKVNEERIHIKGTLQVQVLYAIDRADGKIDCMDGEIPIYEVMNLDGITSGDKIGLKWEIEDLNLELIHSRKLRIRALITCSAIREQAYTLAVAQDLKEDGVSLKKEMVKILGLHIHTRDIVKIREEYNLASNKPDVHLLLWDSAHVRGIDVRAEQGKVLIKGEIFAFVLYEDETDAGSLQWLEFSVPFQKELECEGCHQGMIPDLELMIVKERMTVKPDADGEERVILMELVIEANLKVYEEAFCELLLDVYHPSKAYMPVYDTVCLEQLLIKNNAKCRLQERIQIAGQDGRILQICHSDGTVYVEESHAEENGIRVEGYVKIRILYITGEDDMPFYSKETDVPFSMVVEAPEIDNECRWYLHTDLEQLSTTMVDGSDIELKALINVNALVLRLKQTKLMKEVLISEPDLERIRKMPGIIGYIVKPGDTLWDIAKKYYTSVEAIKTINHLTEDEVRPKDKLILVKNVEC